MKENKFQGSVIDLFQTYQWDVKHSPTPMRPIGGGRWAPDQRGAGMLDLLMTHTDPPRLVLAECKNETGVLSDEQKEMLRRLRVVADYVREIIRPQPCPIGVYVFSPAVWPMIEAIAKGKVMTR